MYKRRIIALSIVLMALTGLPLLSHAATSNEQSLKAEINVGSYTNLTSIGNTITTQNGVILAHTNFSQYSNTTVTALHGNTFNLTQYNGNINGTSLGTFNNTVKFNSTNTAIFDFLNSSYSYLNKLNFTLTKTESAYPYNGISYPVIKIIALGGTESNSSGRDWWFSNQSLEYDPYSGIIFHQAVNTTVILNNDVSITNANYTLIATNVHMGPAAGTGNDTVIYEEIGIAGAVIAAVGLSVSMVRNMRKRNK